MGITGGDHGLDRSRPGFSSVLAMQSPGQRYSPIECRAQFIGDLVRFVAWVWPFGGFTFDDRVTFAGGPAGLHTARLLRLRIA